MRGISANCVKKAPIVASVLCTRAAVRSACRFASCSRACRRRVSCSSAAIRCSTGTSAARRNVSEPPTGRLLFAGSATCTEVTDLRATADQGRRKVKAWAPSPMPADCRSERKPSAIRSPDRLIVDQHCKLGAACRMLRVPAPPGDQAIFLDIFKMSCNMLRARPALRTRAGAFTDEIGNSRQKFIGPIIGER